ncbi:monooxygenase 3-like isoform X2 [Gastrolobium bilobum]|uniref:monooxygenase 3-like isoform X2 n=1 Tax=Gastrolobium bilobum TaxID=150636 RepID=UPI002AB2A630|nr:monooxygenase 3-like isoform X2 [Gastrolobium bilobum]
METKVVEDIVIVGAGIAGLTTSLGLHSDALAHRLGIPSLVLESSDALRGTGFALTAWKNAWKALDAVGVGDILRQQHVQLFGNDTTSLVTGQQTSTTSFRDKGKHGGCEVRCVSRRLMLEALANELPSGTMRYLSKVVAIEESGFSKIIHLADGTTIKTKVLIGCDGINSVVAKWLGFKEASFTRRYAVRGWAESKNNHEFGPRFMQFFGKGLRSGAIPCDEKSVYWFFTWTPTSQDKKLEDNPAKLKQFVLHNLEKMSSDVRSFIEKTELDGFLSVPLRYRHPWEIMFGNISKGNVCVAGDAFHPMTPDLGQGGCSALEDGVVLARCIAEAFSKKPMRHIKEKEEEEEEDQYKRIEEGLKKYANERRWRSIDLISSSYILGSIQQSDSKLVTFLRDKILASFLASIYLKKSDFDCGKLNSS